MTTYQQPEFHFVVNLPQSGDHLYMASFIGVGSVVTVTGGIAFAAREQDARVYLERVLCPVVDIGLRYSLVAGEVPDSVLARYLLDKTRHPTPTRTQRPVELVPGRAVATTDVFGFYIGVLCVMVPGTLRHYPAYCADYSQENAYARMHQAVRDRCPFADGYFGHRCTVFQVPDSALWGWLQAQAAAPQIA